MLYDAGDDEDTNEKEGGDTHNAGSFEVSSPVIRGQLQDLYYI